MLELLNNYAHGYVAVPVILSCRTRGVFDALSVAETTGFGALCTRFGANPGHFRVALALLQALEWVSVDAGGGVRRTVKAEQAGRLPADIVDALGFSFADYLDGQADAAKTARWFAASARRWEMADATLAQFLDGMVVIPLLLALHERGLLAADPTGAPRLLGAGLRHGAEIERFFRDQGWLTTDRSPAWTPLGRFVADRIYITATVASYRPMLASISDVMFGNCRAVFGRDANGAERHVDRRLNVRGSGFQHEKYFSDIEATIVAIFDHPRFDEQPNYIADMGCGDGTLLKRIYQVIRDRTARGRVLDRHPVRLLGIDINDQALQETTLTLQGLDHWVLKGDIGDPERLIEDLRARGIADPESILHVRSFLDHDRPYRAPCDMAAAARRSSSAALGVHVDREGKLIPAGEVMQSLVEHLQRWSAAVGRNGLTVLEVHCLPPETIARYLDKCESLHFDAYHRFSHQYLVTADQFVLAAAEVGLFPSAGESRRYPKVFPFTRITLNHFLQRSYRIRPAYRDDLPALRQLEGGWIEEYPAATEETLAQRLAERPDEQVVLEANGRIVGAAYTCRSDSGERCELLYATVAPEMDEGRAREFVEFVERWCRLRPGCEAFDGTERLRRQRTSAAPAASTDWLGAARRVMAAARGIRDPQGAEGEIETFGVEWLLLAFQTIGVAKAVAQRSATPEELASRVGILPRYERLFRSLLKMLARRGRLRFDGPAVVSLDEPNFAGGDRDAATRSFAEDFRRRHPELDPFLQLMLRCVESYGEVLVGKREANDVVFPGGSVDLFAGIFKGNAAADYFNGLLAEIVVAQVAARGGQRCHILEVGAGTGGTTGAVVSRLDAFGDRLSFCYTDISSTFTRSGERRFGPGRPWMRFERLNIEEDLAAQGFAPESFDIIYAANVLHDTRQLKKTLALVRSLLKPDGLLVLNEYTQMKDLLLLTGGLLHGWWLFEDPENRLEGSCLLSIPLWRSILESGGFGDCHGFGLPGETDLAAARQGVIVASRVEVPAPAAATGGVDVSAVLLDAVHEILGDRRIKAFSPTVPLMECGLDSLELLELRALIGKKLAVELEASFFFQYSTLEKVAAYFRSLCPTAKPERAPQVPAPVPMMAIPVRRSHTEPANGAVAVVGVALRFPGGVVSAADYWELLRSGKSAIGPAAADRWTWPRSVDVAGEKAYLARGGFLPRIDEFDAAFFRLSPREAELLDPQQRLLLELSWAAMEDAGYKPSALRGSRTGVYVGACHFDYRGLLEAPGGPVNALLSTGTAASLLANRISYLHDFQGPSIVFDTACSSSLVALTEAVHAVRAGRCVQALVGGVNLVCSTTNTLAYDHAQMLSRDGDCYPFDARAKGYVRGEGGAVVMLKELGAAIRDGDAIYGVVRGAAVNHGGEASSLTAPNPAAQARVIAAALADGGIAPETIGYVEAHGTGTPLGDPIEIEGLNAALAVGGAGERTCGLGSVKSTLGHLEGAAGLAGFIKVLLCLRQRAIPPSRNFQSLNPEIRLGRRFFVADRLTEWAPRTNAGGEALPRRGGVSAFGFGGANAHAVLEEYATAATPWAETSSPAIVPLSAKSPEALRAAARNLAEFIRRSRAEGSPLSLASLAYTLQTGREAMAYRVAFVATDADRLQRELEQYGADGEGAGPWFASAYDRAGSAMSDLLDGEAGRAFVERLVRDREHAKLARLWVEGIDLDWAQLYGEAKPSRVHLPTYPFARDRFWVPERASAPPIEAAPPRRQFVAHALLHEDISDGTETRFAATFQGDEFFFRDHRVAGQCVLPGVAHLEMAVLAARSLWGAAAGGWRIANVFWTKPVVFERPPLTLVLAVDGKSATDAVYRIVPATAAADAIAFSQGRMEPMPLDAGPQPRIDLAAHRTDCRIVEAEQFYALFDALGIAYGPGQRAVQTLFLGHDVGLAKLTVPASGAAGRFVLHPGLLDSALQAGIAVLLGLEARNGMVPLLPFALESLEVLADCGETMWALARVDRRGLTPALDLDLCGEQGQVAVRFRGLQTRPMSAPRQLHAESAPAADPDVSLFCPVWEPISAHRIAPPAKDARVVVVGGSDAFFVEVRARYAASERLPFAADDSIDAIVAMLERHGAFDHLFWVADEVAAPSPDDEAMIAGQAGGARLCFRFVKALQRLGYERRELSWTLVTRQTQRVQPDDPIRPLHAALHGFCGVLAKECPRWTVRLVDQDAAASCPIDEWLTLRPSASGDTLAWRRGRWHAQELVPVEFTAQRAALPYRRRGVYVVIGGAGGVGAAWSEWMIRNWDAQIVWIGRSPLDARIQEKIAVAGRAGAAPLYLFADATKRDDMEAAHLEIKRRFSHVHGVVHSALVLLDQSLARMDEDRFEAALAAKVDVSVRIAQVFRAEPLDFALFFSSIAAFSRAAGQSNYAAGCTFKDAFAARLGQVWSCPVKVLNWGYWGSVGRVATDEYRAMMTAAGIGSIETEAGMAALNELLASPLPQLAAIKLIEANGTEGIKTSAVAALA